MSKIKVACFFLGHGVDVVTRWTGDASKMCGGRVTIYARQFARLRTVVIDRRHIASQQSLQDTSAAVLLNHPGLAAESSTAEFYSLSPGFFLMSNCDGADDYMRPPSDAFHHGNYLNHWITATRIEPITTTTTVT